MPTSWLRRRAGPHAGRAADAAERRSAAVLFAGAQIVFQPIVSVRTGSLFAAEALTRFAVAGQKRYPGAETVFRAAQSAGYGAALETMCVRAALARRTQLLPNTLVSINLSPHCLHRLAVTGEWPDDLSGVIVEVTEQHVLYPSVFTAAVAALRERGAAVAIDDVGSGYAGLLRLAEHRPDYVKIDRRIVNGVGDSQAQAAVLESLVTLSHRLGAAVIAEGVEDLNDLKALVEFDVDYAQGYAIARPSRTLAPINEEIVRACRAGRKQVLDGPGMPGDAAARTRDVYAVTAALAAAGDANDLTVVLADAAAELHVDVITVSILASDNTLREIATTDARIDPTRYQLANYPATVSALTEGRTLEVHVDDPGGDAAEHEVLNSLGHASMLVVPLTAAAQPIGLIEIAHRTPRRWTSTDIAHAHGLAAHLIPVLLRIGVAS